MDDTLICLEVHSSPEESSEHSYFDGGSAGEEPSTKRRKYVVLDQFLRNTVPSMTMAQTQSFDVMEQLMI